MVDRFILFTIFFAIILDDFDYQTRPNERNRWNDDKQNTNKNNIDKTRTTFDKYYSKKFFGEKQKGGTAIAQ